MRRPRVLPSLVLLLALAGGPGSGASAAPLVREEAAQLDRAREAYLGQLTVPVDPVAWEARYAGGEPTQGYDRLVSAATRAVAGPDPHDPYFRRKALWVRPYAADATHFRVLEVFDRAQAMGVTDLYMETFVNGQVAYGGGSNMAFPPRFPGVNVAKFYAREARRRGMKLYAWVHTLRWGAAEAKFHAQELVYDGWGTLPTAVEGPSAVFVSPSVPRVRDKLYAMVDELTATGYFDGIYLDYIRYPMRVKKDDPLDPLRVDTSSEPRNYWGYNSYALQSFFRENPARDNAAYRDFLFKGKVEDEAQRERWLRAFIDWQAHEVETVIAGIRERTKGKLRLGLAFFPSYYFHRHDTRAQEWARWLGLADEVSALCYSYFPETFPDPHGAGGQTLDRELSILEEALQAQPEGKRPVLFASLTQDPPGTPAAARYHHHPMSMQLAYLKGRRLEGAYPSLQGVALFSYGWLFPESDRDRKERQEPKVARARAAP